MNMNIATIKCCLNEMNRPPTFVLKLAKKMNEHRLIERNFLGRVYFVSLAMCFLFRSVYKLKMTKPKLNSIGPMSEDVSQSDFKYWILLPQWIPPFTPFINISTLKSIVPLLWTMKFHLYFKFRTIQRLKQLDFLTAKEKKTSFNIQHKRIKCNLYCLWIWMRMRKQIHI